jgi:hypothetical protein
MVGITALWLPILLSAVFVFVASAIIHMGLRYHQTDFTAVPGEDKVRAAMRDEGIGPGNYHFPFACGMGELKNPDVIAKFKEGPVGLLTVMPSGPPSMGKNLVQWFIYTVIASILIAYVTGRTLGADAHYLQVFRVAGAVALLTYAGAAPVDSIWKGQKWSTTIKNVFDGLVYALLTAGTFGWLWSN